MRAQARIDNYVRETRFPRSLFVSEDGRIVGTWIMGNDYRVKSRYYGGYPAGYLRRIGALFPDRQRVLHVFSGKVDLAAMPGDTVDCNPDMQPTWLADAHDLRDVPLDDYDLVLCDPPYSIEDAERYQTTMVQRNVVMRSLAAGMAVGAHVVWLDQVLPMYRKDQWKIEGVIGMVKSTNHRFRVVTIFRRMDADRKDIGMMGETAVAWRVWWFIPSDKPFDPTYKHKREYQDFTTLQEAEARKLLLTASLGERGTVCIEPRFISHRAREAKFQEGQDSLSALGWPLQHRPVRQSP